MDTSSTQKTQRPSSKKRRLRSAVPMMGNSCISLRLIPKEEASACGNAQNVTRAAFMMRRARPGYEKRWEHELWVLLPWQVVKSPGLLQLVSLCPRFHPAGQLQTDGKPSPGHALAVDDPRL